MTLCPRGPGLEAPRMWRVLGLGTPQMCVTVCGQAGVASLVLTGGGNVTIIMAHKLV